MANLEFTHMRKWICFALTRGGNFGPEGDYLLEMREQDYMEIKSEMPFSSLLPTIPGVLISTVAHDPV